MFFIERFFDWMTSEPATGLLMIAVTLTLFITALRRNTPESKSLWPWIRRIIESSIGALLFLGMLWGFRSVLLNNTVTFNSTHGSVSDASLKSAQSIWGRPHVQREMTLVHYVTVIEQQEIPQDDPNAPPKYKNVTVRKEVEQNPILGFTGQFDLTLSQREKGYALYSGFVIDAKMTYDVVNDSDIKTEAEFVLPVSQDQTIFDGFQVFMDGKDMGPALRYGEDYVRWLVNMDPHQKSQIRIVYRSRGMEYFYYLISSRHQVTNFNLTVTIDKLAVPLLNYPDGTLSPTSVKATSDNLGSVLNWQLDHTITTAGMGVALLQPQQPGGDVFRVLNNSALALTLLISTAALTILLFNQSFNLLLLILLAASYAAQFLVMAGLSDTPLKFWGALIAGATLSLFLSFMLLRRLPQPLRMILPKDRDPRFITIRRGGTLTDSNHQLLALWAATCSEHVLTLFEAVQPADPRPRQAIAQARAWVRGEVTMTESRTAAGHANGAARNLTGAARYAAYAAAQAAAVAHVAAHELGAAAYAIKAARAAVPKGQSERSGRIECQWQRDQLPQSIRDLVLDDQRLRNEICWSVFDC